MTRLINAASLVTVVLCAAGAQMVDPSLIHGMGWLMALVGTGFYIAESEAHRDTLIRFHRFIEEK